MRHMRELKGTSWGLVLQMDALEDDVAVHGETVEVSRVYAVLEGADEYVVDVYLKVEDKQGCRL